MNKAFENIVGKGENGGNHHFLLFPHFLFSTVLIILAMFNLFCTKLIEPVGNLSSNKESVPHQMTRFLTGPY